MSRDRAVAARAQREATVIGWIDGAPVVRDRLDARLAALRAGPGAGALPALGSGEDRQLVRWAAHVLFTEEICRREAARRHLNPPPPEPLHPVSAVRLGSINAAAWAACPEVAAVFETVVPAGVVPAGEGAGDRRRWYRVSHASAATPELAAETLLTPIGWTTLDDLPAPLAAGLRTASPGDRVGPVRSPLGWHLARVDEIAERAAPDDGGRPRTGERLAAYARWLDRRRAESLRTAEGFEHPGDPSQPDNTHRH